MSKIAKEQWQKWAEQHAEPRAWEIARKHGLDVLSVAALKCLFEQAVLLGMELVETMRQNGYDTSGAKDLRTALVRAKDWDGIVTLRPTTMEPVEVQTDGGGIVLKSPTESPDFPRDGE